MSINQKRGHAMRSWLRHCATSRKVAGSIPDGLIRISNWQSFRPHFGSEIDSTYRRNKYQLTTFPPSCADRLEILESQPSGTPWACNRPAQGLFYLQSKDSVIELRLTELWVIREVEADLWKPTVRACYLILICRNRRRSSKKKNVVMRAYGWSNSRISRFTNLETLL
jgi:hypothetical protein